MAHGLKMIRGCMVVHLFSQFPANFCAFPLADTYEYYQNLSYNLCTSIGIPTRNSCMYLKGYNGAILAKALKLARGPRVDRY